MEIRRLNEHGAEALYRLRLHAVESEAQSLRAASCVVETVGRTCVRPVSFRRVRA